VKKRLLLAVVLLLAAASAYAAYDLLHPYKGYSGSEFIEIAPGSRAPQIASLLARNGVLEHGWPFLFLYAAGRGRHRLEAGEYLFDRPLRPLDVYRMLIRGEVYLRSVVIPEGSDRFDMASILQKDLGLKPAAFLRVTADASPIHDLDPQAPSLEGYLFPDTYRFPHSATASSVVSAMIARFRRVFRKDFASEVQQSGMSLHQVMTLASIVEKETADAPDRPMVAQVFELRLKKGMPLQSDPTVNYATRLDERLRGTVTGLDFHSNSPYNTYTSPRLPPGPICNPGAAAIRAVLHPASTDFLYFVSDVHGGHVFARTLAEHLRNVARYRRQEAALRGLGPSGGENPDVALPRGARSRETSAKRQSKEVNHGKQKKDHRRVRKAKRAGASGNPRTP
jgi:peptidoglycan lytic transglycosylase G